MSQTLNGKRVPEGPTCSKCGHEPCPCCLDWCDRLIRFTGDDGKEDVDLCCDGECDFDPVAIEAWRLLLVKKGLR